LPRESSESPRQAPAEFSNRSRGSEDWQSTDVGMADSANAAAPAEEEEESDRSRRTRRRRGGRGRRPPERKEGGADRQQSRRRDPDLFETPGADDFDDLGEDVETDDEIDSDLDSSIDASGPDGDDEAEGPDDSSTAKGRSPAHRSIPSWEDAIGMIVASNLQSHSQRRATSGNGHGPRGRARGGRRRGGAGGRRNGGPTNQ
jgi:ribonuclease E